ncbi:hypothetical protein K501DRAFT_278445 [Backusella circina FSU 941]|nr:hypothetical protein K501DRAFT_278445 [Backusella circina FSU 941]
MPLFDRKAWDAAEPILKSVEMGYVSDVENGSLLHTEKGIDKYRLMRKFASYNTGPRLVDMVLTDYRLNHNLDMGSKNRIGKTYTSHYSPWLSQAINALKMELTHPLIKDYFGNRCDSFFEFGKTCETFGITSFPISSIYSLFMEPASNSKNSSFINDFDLKRIRSTSKPRMLRLSVLPVSEFSIISYSSRYFMCNYLSFCQGTMHVITAVHTNE